MISNIKVYKEGELDNIMLDKKKTYLVERRGKVNKMYWCEKCVQFVFEMVR